MPVYKGDQQFISKIIWLYVRMQVTSVASLIWSEDPSQRDRQMQPRGIPNYWIYTRKSTKPYVAFAHFPTESRIYMKKNNSCFQKWQNSSNEFFGTKLAGLSETLPINELAFWFRNWVSMIIRNDGSNYVFLGLIAGSPMTSALPDIGMTPHGEVSLIAMMHDASVLLILWCFYCFAGKKADVCMA